MRRAGANPDPALFRRAEELFHSALERPAEERTTYLDGACGRDPALRREVERLLVSDGEGTPLTPVDLEPGHLEPIDPLSRPGARIGAFRLVSELGRGGMGTVWLAARADEAFDQRVAIKLIPKGRDTGEVLARFEHERQVLARLQHPHIAHLLDGGATGDGRPYLVMEHVEGVPIDRHCDERGLSVRERLELFRKVCGAVHYAHQNLVVHRDLKPANILVTPEGEPKLLDFGIAKVLGDGPDTRLTRTGGQPLTPGFASPEQLDGRPVTTASDVYALGALLYRLLAGREPYELEGRPLADCLKAIREEAPRRPSTLRRLSRDLDTITLAALRKEPERRYASADRLSTDIQRYLDGMPVEARGDTLGYVATKFVRRHRLGIAAVSAVFGALVAGLYVANAARAREVEQRGLAESRLVELGRAAEALAAERDAVLAQQALAEERFDDIREFATASTVELLTALRPIPGTTAARGQVMELGLDYLERLAPHATDDPEFAFELARSYLRLGQLQGDYGDATVGRTGLALESTARGVQIAERLWTEDGEGLDHALVAAGARRQEAKLLIAVGRTAEAKAAVERALEICGAFDAASELNAGHFYTWGLCTMLWAQILNRERRHAEAVDVAGRGLEIYDRALDRWPGDRALSTDRAHALADTAGFLAAMGSLEEAIDFQVESILAMRALAELPEDSLRLGREVLLLESSLAYYLGESGDGQGARELIDQVVAEFEERGLREPDNRQARLDVAIAYTGSGNIYLMARDFEGALPVLERALEVWSELVASDPKRTSLASDRADGLVRLARAERGSGRLDAAHGHLTAALAERERLHAADPENPRLTRNTIEICAELGTLELAAATGPSADAARVARAEALLARGRGLLAAAVARGTPSEVLAGSRGQLDRLEDRCRAASAE